MSKSWKTGSKETISIDDILNILEKVVSSKNHKIIVGSDSVKLGTGFVFTKAICILNNDYYDRRYFYFREKIKDDSFLDLHKRLLKETSDSIGVAIKIKKRLSNANIEVHADVNSDIIHESSRHKNMIMGYITGCGFDVRIKPFSFVASSIADLHTRKC
jgi:uncharacterized protein